MSAVEVARTLVKSPPELWSEIETAERLGRWLGEIKITRVESESLIEWEGDRAQGSIAIEATGWGTRVKLTAAELAGETAPVEPVSAEHVERVDPVSIEPVEPVSAEPVEQLSAEPAEPVPAELESEISHEADASAETEVANNEEAMDQGGAMQGTISPPDTKRSLRQRIAGLFKPAEPADLKLDLDSFGKPMPGFDTSEFEPSPANGEADGAYTAARAHDSTFAGNNSHMRGPEPPVASEPATTSEQSNNEAPARSDTAPLDLEQTLTEMLDDLGSAHKRPFTNA